LHIRRPKKKIKVPRENFSEKSRKKNKRREEEIENFVRTFSKQLFQREGKKFDKKNKKGGWGGGRERSEG